jgi:hypothetical protein
MAFKLRYYAPRLKPTDYSPLPEEHKKIMWLLKQLREKHKIESEIIDLSMGDVSIPAEIIRERITYERKFLPRKETLKKRTGVSLSLLKRYGLAGTIAIICNGEIEWYTIPRREFKKYDDNFRIGFLKMLLDDGPRLLSELCAPINLSDTEHKILKKFINSGVLKGSFQENIRVGLARIKREASSDFMLDFFSFRKAQDNRLLSKLKWIDAVCSIKDTVWVLEVEKKLNETALGQALVYRDLFAEDHPPEDYPKLKIKAGIVCETSDPWIKDICEEYEIQVFVV